MEKDGENNITLESLGVLDLFAFHERCLQEGICPKGCGPLEVKSFRERACPVCHSVHYNANPERTPHATE